MNTPTSRATSLPRVGAASKAAVTFLATCAVVFGACTGSSQTDPTVTPTPSATPTATATPSPTPTATPDPRVIEIDEVVEVLAIVRADGAFMGVSLRRARNGEPLKGVTEVLQICDRIPSSFGRNIIDKNGDIWPTPYKELDSAIAVTCAFLEGKVKELGQPDTSLEWTVAIDVIYASLDKAANAIPDYSNAELRRAIAARQ